VGRCAIPLALYQAMKTAPFYLVEKTMNERLEIIERDYGKASYQDLAIATERITKRLGGARTKQALAHLSSGHFRKWVEVVLEYYDKSYQASIKKRDTIIPFCLKSFAAGRDMSGKEATP
jgi:tRNA 2-selenouridine synthase